MEIIKNKRTYIFNWDISLNGIVWKLFKSSKTDERLIKIFKTKQDGLNYLGSLYG